MKSLRTMLGENRPVVGLTVYHLTNPWVAELYARAGTDFVFVDYEHCFFNEGDLMHFILACRMKGLPVVAKIPELSRGYVIKLLDAGVVGIQMPGIEAGQEAERLVSLMKFPPRGVRPACPGIGNNDYDHEQDAREFIEIADRETVAVAHIETCAGVENIDDILSVDGIDVAFLGMYDFSLSFGHPGDFTHPEVVENVEKVLDSAKRHNVVAGAWAPDQQIAEDYIRRGVTFFETVSELDMIQTGSAAIMKQFRRKRAT